MAYALWIWKSNKLVGNSVVDKNTTEFDLWKKANQIRKNSSAASLPLFRWGDFIQKRSDGDPADYTTKAWLAKDCDGKEWYRKLHLYFTFL